MEKLREVEKQLSKCIKEKKCTYGEWPDNLPMCPPYKKFGFFSYSGGGMLYLGRALLLNLIEPSQDVLKILSTCTTCGFCGDICKLVPVSPPHLPVHELIRMVKAEMIERGVDVSPKEKMVLDSIKKDKNPFQVPNEKRKKARDSFFNSDAKVLIFSGCVNELKRRNALDATIKILKKAKVDFSLLGDEWCCGAPLYDMGHMKEVKELADHNLKEIEKTSAEKIIFLCPHCMNMFKSYYPKITDKKVEAKLVYVTQYVLDLAREGLIRFSGAESSPEKVAFHDPCYLARYVGDVESVRDLLKFIPSLEVVEMKRNKMETYCCGAGGGVRVFNPDYSMEIGMDRMKEFMKTGANGLITSCPHCLEQFIDGKKQLAKDISISDSSEFILDYIAND